MAGWFPGRPLRDLELQGRGVRIFRAAGARSPQRFFLFLFLSLVTSRTSSAGPGPGWVPFASTGARTFLQSLRGNFLFSITVPGHLTQTGPIPGASSVPPVHLPLETRLRGQGLASRVGGSYNGVHPGLEGTELPCTVPSHLKATADSQGPKIRFCKKALVLLLSRPLRSSQRR